MYNLGASGGHTLNCRQRVLTQMHFIFLISVITLYQLQSKASMKQNFVIQKYIVYTPQEILSSYS